MVTHTIVIILVKGTYLHNLEDVNNYRGDH